jgi:hypothetical protein
MKKITLFILAALLISVVAFGQDKAPVKPSAPAPAAAPGFQINPAKVYSVTLTGTIDKFNALTFTITNGIPVVDDTDLPAKTRKEAKVNATELNTSLQAQLQALILADRKKFTADSLAALKKQ